VAEGLAVVRQRPAIIVDDLHVDTEDGPALLHLHVEALLQRAAVVLAQKAAHRTEWRHLGHAPCVHDKRTELLLEFLAHRARRGRTADDNLAQHEVRLRIERACLRVLQQHEPDRRHAKGHRHLLVAQQFVDALAVQSWPGHHQLGAGQSSRVGHAPSVDMEHRHHQQQRFRGGNAQAVDCACGVGMKDRGRCENNTPLGCPVVPDV
jgi:hypothetical protein